MVISYLHILLTFLFWFQNPESPNFKGGKSALDSFIKQYTIYPEFSKNNCIEGTIYIGFNIDKNGAVVNASVEKGLGIDLDEEALRIIKMSSGSWQANNNNNKFIIPVSFSLKNHHCEGKSEAEIQGAVNYYKTQEALQGTVFSYYKNKNEGKSNTASEADIIRLKQQLGFDDDFINHQLTSAKKMLQQKDNEGACKALQIIKNIGSDRADELIAQNCGK